jgi:hypothetical protein
LLPGFGWVKDWIHEHAVFPKGAQDGRVDSAQMAVNELTTEKVLFSKFMVSSVKPFLIAWGKSVSRPTLHYCTLYLDKKTMEIFALASLWDDLAGKLYCYSAYKAPSTDAVAVAKWIIRTMHPEKYVIDFVLSNDELFADREGKIGKGARGVSKVINDEFRKGKVSAKVRRARRFDLTGSIYEANRMFDENRILPHTSAQDAAKQWAAWGVKEGKPETNNAGYCFALCILISDLKMREKLIPKIKKRPDYKRSSVINKTYLG